MSKIPSYRQVYISLKQDIKNGVYEPDTLIPTETELEKKYAVSRTTIRKVVSILTAEGFLLPKQGKGTIVKNVSNTQRLNKITSITETLQHNGHIVTTKGMHIQKIPAPDNVAEYLTINKGEMVYIIERVQFCDGSPLALISNYFKANAVPGLEKYENQFTGLYNFIEHKYNIILTEAEEKLSAIQANFIDSQILQVDVGSPLLCSKRVSYTEQGPVEYALCKMVPDKYEYSVYLKGR